LRKTDEIESIVIRKAKREELKIYYFLCKILDSKDNQIKGIEVPKAVLEKYNWCNSNYEEPGSSLSKVNIFMMEINSNIVIHTNRLILEPIHEKYIDDINTGFTQEITTYMPFNPNGDRNEIINFVENAKNNLIQKTDIVFVALNLKREFIGCCGIHNINKESVELGLWLRKEYQNQGFGTEIINVLTDFAEQNLEFNYMVYPVDKENIRSRRIPENLGFIPFKTYKQKKSDSIDLNIIEFRKYKA
jgi:ribosomal-protein-alanine N-acetyltransferase